MNVFNSIVSWAVKKRYHQIDLFVKYPLEVQNEVLQKLISSAKDTEYGNDYRFQEVNNYSKFSKNIPVNKYEDLVPYIDKMRQGNTDVLWPGRTKWFAKSSGTTNAKSKFIPVSNQTLQNCHYKAGKDMLSIYVNNNPDTDWFTGKTLRLGGSHEIYGENNSYFGDLSAILIEHMPFWVEFRSVPNTKISLMSEWEAKLDAIVKTTINEDVRALAGVPSWMLVMLQKILEYKKVGSIIDVWPNLEVYLHGGVSFTPYDNQFNSIIGKDIHYYEIYNASEGFFGIQYSNDSKEMLLMLDYGIYYEFIPKNVNGEFDIKDIIPLADVKTNTVYSVIISNNSGLWRYDLGDTIMFTNTLPYLFKVIGRTKHFINVFGEELMISNVEEALKTCCALTGATIIDYTACPIFMSEGASGGHEWLIEFGTLPSNLKEFTTILDDSLKDLNSDYEAKRYNDITIAFPKINIAKKGLFLKWLTMNNKLGGQNKIPRLSNSRKFMDELLGL